MRGKTWMAALAVLLLAGGLAAQEVTKDQGADESTQASRHKIRVLQDPYDLAGFYRASDGSAYGYGFFSYDRDGRLQAAERYPIASYYRSPGRESFGYWHAQAWRRAPLPARRVRRANATARHSELYLFLPALLVPVLPLAEEPDEGAAEPAVR